MKSSKASKMKPSSNGFVFLMQELRNKHPAKYPSMASVTADAGEIWGKMTDEQKQPYADKARKAKGKEAVKYTSDGIPLSFIQKRANDELAEEYRMKEAINNLVNFTSASNTTATHMFYFAHVNYSIYHERDNKYYPAEVGLCRFNFEEGVIMEENTYHAIVHPGKLPLGFTYEAKRISEENHRLPVSNGSINNLEEVWNGIVKFMSELNPGDAIPPVYALKSNAKVIQNVFNNLGYQFGYEDDYIKVHSIEYLLFTLRNMKEAVWPTISLSQLTLEKDVYDFTKNIACEYHDASEVPNFCSKSFVIRMAYIFCDNICKSLNITVIPGRHVPVNSKVDYYTVVAPPTETKPKPKVSQSTTSSVAPSLCDEDEDLRSEIACSVDFHECQDDLDSQVDRMQERVASSLSVTSACSYHTVLTSQSDNEDGDGEWQEQKGKGGKRADKSKDLGALRRPNQNSQILSFPNSSSGVNGLIAPRGRGRGYTK